MNNRLTINVEVDDLLSPLAGRGLEKHLAHAPGIARAAVNDASGGVSVTYDPGCFYTRVGQGMRLSLQR